MELSTDVETYSRKFLSTWIEIFTKLPSTVQTDALTELVGRCTQNQIIYLRDIIAPYFKKDFVTLLPRELALSIMGYLRPEDLIQAAQISKYWRSLAEDKLLWAEKCRQYEIKEIFPPSLSRHENWQATYQNNSAASEYTPPSTNTSPVNLPQLGSGLGSGAYGSCLKRSQWKAIYLRNVRILNNWRKRNPSAQIELRGHDEHVITCLCLKNDLIATGSDDHTVRIWSAVTAQCLHVLTGHVGGVWALQLSEMADIVVSGSTDRTVRIWDVFEGSTIYVLTGHTSTVRCMALRNDYLITGSRDCTLRMWNIRKGQHIQTFYGHLAAVRCVQFDGKIIASGAYDFNIIVWNAADGIKLHILQGHSNRVYSLLLTESGLIVSGSLDTTIRVWSSKTGECLQTFIGHQSLTSGLQLISGTNILVSSNADSTIKVWDISKGHCLHTLSGQFRHSSAVTSLQYLENGLLVTSGDDGTVKLWDVKKGEFVCDLVRLPSASAGGCVWRLKATPTILVCAVGSRNGTEDTKLILMDFDAPYP